MTTYTKAQLDALLDQRDRLNKELAALSVKLEQKRTQLTDCIAQLQKLICPHDEGIEVIVRPRMDTLGQFVDPPERELRCRVCMLVLPNNGT